jgi:hypothetical protein
MRFMWEQALAVLKDAPRLRMGDLGASLLPIRCWPAATERFPVSHRAPTTGPRMQVVAQNREGNQQLQSLFPEAFTTLLRKPPQHITRLLIRDATARPR